MDISYCLWSFCERQYETVNNSLFDCLVLENTMKETIEWTNFIDCHLLENSIFNLSFAPWPTPLPFLKSFFSSFVVSHAVMYMSSYRRQSATIYSFISEYSLPIKYKMYDASILCFESSVVFQTTAVFQTLVETLCSDSLSWNLFLLMLSYNTHCHSTLTVIQH